MARIIARVSRKGKKLGIKIYQEPKLKRPDMIAAWPGIGNIGIIAVDALRSEIGAEEFAEIEPWDFFYPRKVVIRGGILEDLVFPNSKFYFKKLDGRDLIIFIGEEQANEAGRMYAEGRKAYELASLVLDVAERFSCRRIYTSGAAVAMIHHTTKPLVWTVTSTDDLAGELKGYQIEILKSGVEGTAERGSITGLNGLLLGMAKRRGFESVCLMGEIPDYLSGASFPYPKASRSVLEVLTKILGVEINYTTFDGMTAKVNEIVEGIYSQLPVDVRERIDQRKQVATKAEAITVEEERWIKEHVEELFRKRGQEDDRAA
jgi:proteasome assembly chaperone (PAC2) family protein